MGIRDGGTPPLEQAIRATVIVNVVYNLQRPSFSNCPRSLSLREDLNAGSPVYTITVADGDTLVVIFFFFFLLFLPRFVWGEGCLL